MPLGGRRHSKEKTLSKGVVYFCSLWVAEFITQSRRTGSQERAGICGLFIIKLSVCAIWYGKVLITKQTPPTVIREVRPARPVCYYWYLLYGLVGVLVPVVTERPSPDGLTCRVFNGLVEIRLKL